MQGYVVVNERTEEVLGIHDRWTSEMTMASVMLDRTEAARTASEIAQRGTEVHVARYNGVGLEREPLLSPDGTGG